MDLKPLVRQLDAGLTNIAGTLNPDDYPPHLVKITILNQLKLFKILKSFI